MAHRVRPALMFAFDYCCCVGLDSILKILAVVGAVDVVKGIRDPTAQVDVSDVAHNQVRTVSNAFRTVYQRRIELARPTWRVNASMSPYQEDLLRATCKRKFGDSSVVIV